MTKIQNKIYIALILILITINVNSNLLDELKAKHESDAELNTDSLKPADEIQRNYSTYKYYVTPGLNMYNLGDMVSKETLSKTTQFYMGANEKIETLYEYQTAHIMQLDCYQHVRFLGLNYACLKEGKEYFPRKNGFFVVEKNFTKYFMIISDKMQKYEFFLDKSFKGFDISLVLLEHKTLKGRFVGIYQYEKYETTLDFKIRTTNINIYKKFSYMEAIVTIIQKVMEYKDANSPYLNLDLSPSNLLLTKGRDFEIKLSRLIPNRPDNLMFSSTPENRARSTFYDKRTHFVFIIGKLFYFILFRFQISQVSLIDLNFLKDYENLELAEEFKYDIRLIKLIRRMLNENPVDRPKLSEVADTLHIVKFEAGYFKDQLLTHVSTYYRKMVIEVQSEITTNRLKNEENFKKSLLARQNKQNSIWKSMFTDDLMKSNELATNHQVNKIFEKNIRNDINENDKFQMINDIYLEDVIDDHLKNKILLERLRKRQLIRLNLKLCKAPPCDNSNYNTFEGETEIMNTLSQISVQNLANPSLNEYINMFIEEKLMKIENATYYRNVMKTLKMDSDDISKTDYTKPHHDHHDHHEHGFVWQFWVLIVFTQIITGFILLSLWFKKTDTKFYEKKDFQTWIEI